MDYRKLGQNEMKISEFSLAAWMTYGDQVGEYVTFDCMKAAYDHRVNFLDNADVSAIGQAEIVPARIEEILENDPNIEA